MFGHLSGLGSPPHDFWDMPRLILRIPEELLGHISILLSSEILRRVLANISLRTRPVAHITQWTHLARKLVVRFFLIAKHFHKLRIILPLISHSIGHVFWDIKLIPEGIIGHIHFLLTSEVFLWVLALVKREGRTTWQTMQVLRRGADCLVARNSRISPTSVVLLGRLDLINNAAVQALHIPIALEHDLASRVGAAHQWVESAHLHPTQATI